MAYRELREEAVKEAKRRGDVEKGNVSNYVVEKLKHYHKEEADYLWMLSGRPSGYRTAHHYRLASEAASDAGHPTDAAVFAHYAGHRFREMGEFEDAAKDYIRSAGIYKDDLEAKTAIRGLSMKASSSDRASASGGDSGSSLRQKMRRSAMRAIGCLLTVGEFDAAAKVAEDFQVTAPHALTSSPIAQPDDHADPRD
jgi:hypothetical protein